jgi:dTDP-glucose pyrophosphorylase
MPRPDLVQRLSVGTGTTLYGAIEQITRAERKILLVVNETGRLEGVMTDYDIRQAILNQCTFDRPVGEVIGRNPVIADACASEKEIIVLMQRTHCRQIPIVDGDGRPVDVRFDDEFLHLQEGKAERVAVVMAGGLGARLRPMTEHTPKPLLDIGGRPILFTLLDQIISEGFTKIYISLFYKGEMIMERVLGTARYCDCVEFVTEAEPLGTGGALGLLPCAPINPFLIMNADLVTEVPLREMLEFHRREGNSVTVALKRHSFEVPYGVAEVRDGRIVALREKPEIAVDVNTGVYVASPAILNLVPPRTKLDMPQLINQLLSRNARIGSFPVHELWLDVGTHEQYDDAKIRFASRAHVIR